MKFNAGDIIVVNFPGVTGVKRRPVVVLSSAEYHSCRPDVIVGVVTGQTATALSPTDHTLQDWKQAGLRKVSSFRSFFATLPRSAHQRILGRLSKRDWEAVCACVNKAMAIG